MKKPSVPGPAAPFNPPAPSPVPARVLALALACLLVLAMPGGARALPDDEVRALAGSSSEFKAAEDRILRVWGSLPSDIKSRVRAEQIEWIKTVRDREAGELMSGGMSKAEAYAEVTNKKSDYLESLTRGGGSSSSSSSSSASASSANPPADPEQLRRTKYLALMTDVSNKKYADAFDGMTELARGGFAPAQYQMYNFYYHGRGVAEDKPLARQWLARAAEGGDPEAQHMLAQRYETDDNDVESAMAWYKKAAEGGSLNAGLRVGAHYIFILGGGAGSYSEQQDHFQTARRWLLPSARGGNSGAQFLMGRIYFEGMGVDVDMDEARRWFTLALDNGEGDARKYLDRM
ncbi:MAG: sel1 repeat family protein [Deltaproteobacteria bacterium]|nr:sel1 repeat family protein [Deltaproteobacteria bacterium]